MPCRLIFEEKQLLKAYMEDVFVMKIERKIGVVEY
jgi:hypothetical protein